MIRRLYLLTLAAMGLLVMSCGGAQRGQSPGLIVLISVDQLPYYLLEHTEPQLTGGLRRLLDEGRSYARADHDHGRTYTSPGHATLATGVHPSRHGIVSNTWWEEGAAGIWTRVGSVDDPDTPLTGVPGSTGATPRNLMARGLADWIEAADPEAEVVSIAGKGAAAILMAGRGRGHVYWLDGRLGRFVSSVYYRSSYPDWVDRFNRAAMPTFLADSIWASSVPESARHLARRDEADYERDGVHVAFPHSYADEAVPGAAADPKDYYDWWKRTPALDEATLALAREAVASLDLGRRRSIDYLALGLSSTDRVGHLYGPMSLEQLDNILRLDRALGEFLDFLDGTVGQGNYVVALSSDHGTLPMPEYLQETGATALRVPREEYMAARRSAIASASSGGSPREAVRRAVAALESYDFVADVMTLEELADQESADSFVALAQRSYYPGRVWGGLARQGLVWRLTEGTLAVYGDRTTHGSPYMYDRHVPIIFMGKGVPAGSSRERVRAVDVAPTLAALAGIAYPEDLDGKALFAER